MISKKASIVLMSLAGAGLVHAALACSSGAGGYLASLDGSAEARADTPASACTKWEVQGFVPPKFTKQEVAWGTDDKGQPNLFNIATFDAFTLPAGWEPLNGGSIGSPIIARHCLSSSSSP
ncbi:hypothetical protein BH11MYX4_BH11MYX4_56760 [soil metagenome]